MTDSTITPKFYNTLTLREEPFIPLDPENVRMYVCGPTVYDYAHIGNARPAVIFDTLYRFFKILYPKVTYVRNITDVDDKIIKASEETKESIEDITKRTTQAYHDDMAALNTLLPDIQPKATEHILEMIQMIKILVDKGHAYEAEGHVLFSVSSAPSYGCLSHRNRKEMIAGARVEVASYKKNPADFVLWKPSSDDVPGWGSPWGRGRPGWHIECSAMSQKYLGNTFDIHGGGQDLIFPHHENELAQSTCAHSGAPFARYWLHNGYLTIRGEKMSKSLGNFRTVHELLEHVPGEVIRYALLSAHYRQPLDWSEDSILQAKASLDRLYTVLRQFDHQKPDPSSEPSQKLQKALADDLGTPQALAHLHALATNFNKSKNEKEKAEIHQMLLRDGQLLGLLEKKPEQWFKDLPQSHNGLHEEEIEKLITARETARGQKDFAEADRIRKELESNGISLEDTPSGTLWRHTG